jgi:hypothetical protein
VTVATAQAPSTRPCWRRDRYVADIVTLHDRMSLRGLADLIEPLYLARRPGGLTVLAARRSQLPERYQLAIYGFRLAQYLRSGFASADVAFERAMFAEPDGGCGEEIHVIGLEEATGSIVRYISIVASPDPEPMALSSAGRSPFPCEVAHGINLFDHVGLAEPVTSSEVWEIKRLMQRDCEAQAPGMWRLRVSLELMLAFYSVLATLDPAVKLLIGDGEEGLAIRRLLRSLKEVTVIEGTRPSLPHNDLLHPAYTQREAVKPFVARAPRGAELSELVGRLERALSAADPLSGFKQLVAETSGDVRRVSL